MSQATRAARYREKREASGFVEVRLTCSASVAARLRSIAERTRSGESFLAVLAGMAPVDPVLRTRARFVDDLEAGLSEITGEPETLDLNDAAVLEKLLLAVRIVLEIQSMPFPTGPLIRKALKLTTNGDGDD